MYSVFYTKTDYDVSCLAMEWRSNGIKDVFVSVSFFDETSQLMSPQVISLSTVVIANLASHGFLLAVTLNTCWELLSGLAMLAVGDGLTDIT